MYESREVRVVLLENIHARAVESFQRLGYAVAHYKQALEGDELKYAIKDAQIVGIRSKTNFTKDILESVPNLWTVGAFCIGTNQIDLDVAAGLGVPVFNAPFSNTRSVAELTIAEAVALNRQLGDRSSEVHRGIWKKSAEGCHEVRGRTLGIIGYGHIGSQVSVLAEAMGMRVVFHDIVDVLPLGNAERARSLEALLEVADVVTLHVPETTETINLMGRLQFAAMKPGSVLINNARGTVVDIDALVDHLNSGHLAGAAIDVFPTEPAGAAKDFSSPLQGLPNVILTPHVGGSTLEAQIDIASSVSGRLMRFASTGSSATAVNVPEVSLPMLHAGHKRVLHFHRNVPGMLAALNRTVAELGMNIAAQVLQSDQRHSYTILDVHGGDTGALQSRLEEIPETIRVRVI